MKIAIVMPNWVGDAVMSTPAIAAIDARWRQQAELIGVMRPVVAELLTGAPWFDQVVPYEPRGGSRSSGWFSATGKLAKLRPDCVLLLTAYWRSAVMAWYSGARRRIGRPKWGRSILLTEAIRHPAAGSGVAALDVYLALAAPLTDQVTDRQPRLFTTEKDEQLADEAWRCFGWSPQERPLVLNTGAAYGPAKDWPPEYFLELAKEAVARYEARVLLLCGPAEQQSVLQIEQQARHESIRSMASFSTDIGVSKACVRRARAMVSTDSGPRHFAAAFNIPCASLFGPTEPSRSLGAHQGELHLSVAGLNCRPCHSRRCPLGHHRCMRDLSVQRVMQAIDSIWEMGAESMRAA